MAKSGEGRKFEGAVITYKNGLRIGTKLAVELSREFADERRAAAEYLYRRGLIIEPEYLDLLSEL